MSETKMYTEKEIHEIIDNMVEAISVSEHFMHRLLMADMIEESQMLKRQTDCCFRVLGAVANLNELLAYEKEYMDEESFDLCDFTREIVDSCRVKTRNHLAKIKLDCTDVVMIHCNRDRAAACLMNLIVNSLQQVDPEEGEIKVSVKKRHDFAYLTVSDDGYGMTGVDPSEYTKEGATGGLAVVNRFCKYVGTTPIIETSENGGFTVTVRIPLADGSIVFNASETRPKMGLLSPVNIYLAKIKRFDVANLYR